MNFMVVAYLAFFVSLFFVNESFGGGLEASRKEITTVTSQQIQCFKSLSELLPEQETIHSNKGMYFFPTWSSPGKVDRENPGVANQLRVLIVLDEQSDIPYYYELESFDDVLGYSVYHGVLERFNSGDLYKYRVHYSYLLDGPAEMVRVSRDSLSSSVQRPLVVQDISNRDFEIFGETLLNYRFQEKLNSLMNQVRWRACDPEQSLTMEDVRSSDLLSTCQAYPWSSFKRRALKRLKKQLSLGCSNR